MALNSLFKDIMRNFNTVANTNNHQTLMVKGDKLDFDNRNFQALRRMISDDGRKEIIKVISKTLKLTQELLHSYQNSIYLQQLTPYSYQAENIFNNVNELQEKKEGILQGLDVLGTFERYVNDPSFQLEIDEFKKIVHRICDKCLSISKQYKKMVNDIKYSEHKINY